METFALYILTRIMLTIATTAHVLFHILIAMSIYRSEPSNDLLQMGMKSDEGTSDTKTENTSEETQRSSHTRIKNRRKTYLDMHPSYFDSPDLELAGLDAS